MAQVKNLDKLRAKLRALPKEVQSEIRKGLSESADEITALQKKLVLVSKGAPSKGRHLRDTIGWVYGDAPAGAVLTSGKKSVDPETTRGDLRITIFAGETGKEGAFHARYVEFGTKAGVRGDRTTSGTGGRRTRKVMRTHPGTPAAPFFYPAYRALRKRAKSKVSRGITKAAKKVAQR